MFNKLKQKVNEEYSNDLTPANKSLTNGRKASHTSSEQSHSNDESIKESTGEKVSLHNKESPHTVKGPTSIENGSCDSSAPSTIKKNDSKASTESATDKNQDLKKLNQSLLDHIDVLTVNYTLNSNRKMVMFAEITLYFCFFCRMN